MTGVIVEMEEVGPGYFIPQTVTLTDPRYSAIDSALAQRLLREAVCDLYRQMDQLPPEPCLDLLL